MITLIAAVSKNGFIGVNGELPWKLPDDMAHFKNITTGNVVVMGRKTFESIGEPLPDRANIVISRTMDFTTPGMYGQTSLEAALEFGKNIGEVFVIGGGEIYESAISLADKLIITHVDEEVDGDVP
jgi:dihydrofolate reductase